MPLICFDNAATGWPKPRCVQEAVLAALRQTGNPGRGGHPLAQRGSETLYRARETAAALLGGRPEHTVFTGSCTHALNLAVHGLLKPGSHVIISDLEHNAVWRPLHAMAKHGSITYSIAHISPQTEKTRAALRRLIQKNTRAVIMTAVSNVTGQRLPVQEIAALCKEYGLLYIVDGAQACGVLPLRVDAGISVLCTAGHKGFYGPAGTGLLLTDGSAEPVPLMQGGTGSQSGSPEQPDYLPDALEPGTLNVPGIAGMAAGMALVEHIGMPHIFAHESALCEHFMAGLRKTTGAVIFRTAGADYAPLVSFRLQNESPSQTAERLAAAGICMRAGLHCAPLAHHALGTAKEGTVRFAPSVFNTEKEVELALDVLRG